MILRALTLWRPWPASIVAGPKRAENRPWAHQVGFPPGSVIALHAGAKWDAAGAAFIHARWPELDMDPAHHPKGVIVGLTEVVRYDRINRDPTEEDPWAFGPWVWRLGRVVPLLFPVAVRGAQGLWTLPLPVERGLLDVWRGAA